jgi:photosystem II stability/assembly factor-like uncharacterized protein
MVEGIFALLFGAVAAGAVALVVAPLRRREAEPVSQDVRRAELLATREAAIRAIHDLDFDYRLGNLAEEDYRELRERQSLEAMALLRATNARSPGEAVSDDPLDAEIDDPLDAEIERRVREARARREGQPARASHDPHGRPPAGRARGSSSPDRPAPAAPANGSRPARPPAIGRPHNGHARAVRSRRPAPSGRLWSLSARGARWLAVGTVVGLALVAGIGWLYLSARAARADQQPVSQLPPIVGQYHSLVILPGQPAIALLGSPEGLLGSRDGGRTWGRLPASGDVITIASHPARPRVIYAAGRDLFLVSEDGGQSWAALRHDLPGRDVRALAFDPDAPAGLYAYVADQGLFGSSDGGVHWTLLDARVRAQTTAIAVMGGARRRVYLATADQGILASPDGRAWGAASGFLNGALPTRRVNALVYDQRSGDSVADGASPALTGALYAGTDWGLFKSVDGGGSWTRLPLQADVASTTFDPANPAVLLVVDAQGRIFRSEDRGLTWRNGR